MADKNNLQNGLVNAQMFYKPAKKSGRNPHLKSEYSTLRDVQNAVYPALHEQGIFVIFGIVWHEQTPIGVECKLVMGDESVSIVCPANFSGNAQQRGAEITYAKRYALIAITGAEIDDGTDDDGESVKDLQQPKPVKPKPTVKEMMSKIAKAETHDKLMAMRDYVEKNCNTSKGHLLKCIENRKEVLDEADSHKSWEE